MGKADTAVKTWLNNNERFADLFNGTVFGGEQIVLPDELEDLDRETDILATDKTGKERSFRRHRDLVKRWKKKVDLSVLACEAQDKIHYAMPVRGTFNDGLFYTDQIREIWRQYEQKNKRKSASEKEKLTEGEFLSRFRKGDRIYPIINLVFYYDLKKWDGATDLYDMFQLNDVLSCERILRKYIPNYRINLIDAGNMGSIKKFHSDLQQIFGVLQCRGKKDDLHRYIQEHRKYFENIDLETYQALRHFLHSERALKDMKDSKEETINMCKALEELYNDGVTKGREEGIAAFIKSCCNLGVSKDGAVSQLVLNYKMDEKEARLAAEEYWS